MNQLSIMSDGDGDDCAYYSRREMAMLLVYLLMTFVLEFGTMNQDVSPESKLKRNIGN